MTRATLILLAASAAFLFVTVSPIGPGAIGSAWAAPGDEEDIEDQIEDEIDDAVEAVVEDAVEDQVEDEVEDAVESQVEDTVEDAVEAAVEAAVENEVEDQVEGAVEDKVEDEVEDAVESEVEDQVEDEVEDEAEDKAEDKAEGEVEEKLEDEAEDHVEDDAGQEDGSDAEGKVAKSNAGNKAPKANTKTSLNASAEIISDKIFQTALDQDGNEIGQGEWLVIGSADAIDVLGHQGYVTKAIETLDGLGLILARLEAPDNFNIKEAQASIRSILPDAIVDFDHVYHPSGEATEILSADDASPSDLLDVQEDLKASRRLIGVIDTNIDLTHRTLKGAKIHVRSFIPYRNHQPTDHGTSIVSILVGDSRGFHGLLRNAEIYAASVFFDTPAGGQSTTTTSLVLALNWMVENNVPIVNMSLTGPANAVLRSAIDRAYDKGLVIVAAVGNAGPNAAPLYPAAYDKVVSVTAVSSSNHVYRLANRGDYVDFSAPGVNIRHADDQGGFSVSSGTSYAAPFVAAVLSVSGDEAGAINAARLEELATHAQDLGPEGYDPIYGYGLIRPLDN